MEFHNKLETLITKGTRIIALETFDADRVVDFFREISRFSSKPYYLAEPGTGLYRLGAAHITIPNTSDTDDLLIHIRNSKHFGVFLLKNFEDLMASDQHAMLLEQIATGDSHKIVILIDEFIDIPDRLIPHTMVSEHQLKESI